VTALTTGAAAFLARAEGATPRLPGADLPWLAQLRAAAAIAFRGQGFPNRRVEAWKYTDLAAAMQAEFGEPLSSGETLPALPR
jgi:Fe-S cluster assembly protein SufD